MASNTILEFKFSVCLKDGCSLLSLSDTTGEYDVNINPYGWFPDTTGSSLQLPYISDVETCIMKLYEPDGTEHILDLFSSYNAFLSLTGTPVNIVSEAFSLDTFVDGWYTINIEISGRTLQGITNDWSTSYSEDFFFTCNAQCKIDNMFSMITDSDLTNTPSPCLQCDSKSNSILQSAIQAQAFLNSAINAACCSKKNMAIKLLNRASFEAAKQGCTSCHWYVYYM